MIDEKIIKQECAKLLSKRLSMKYLDATNSLGVNICEDFWGVRKILVIQIHDHKFGDSTEKCSASAIPDSDFELTPKEFSEKFLIRMTQNLQISKQKKCEEFEV